MYKLTVKADDKSEGSNDTATILASTENIAESGYTNRKRQQNNNLKKVMKQELQNL